LYHLLGEIEFGLIDAIVVYNIDSLSRSLMNFSRQVQLFPVQQARW
jgi:DNA invertase Pin-like site-specific DNA recombinase